MNNKNTLYSLEEAKKHGLQFINQQAQVLEKTFEHQKENNFLSHA